MNPSALHTILYVEDDARVRDLLKMALELIGRFHVIGCGSGRAALAQASASEPDLILLDAMMPGFDGISMLGLLRRAPQLARCPVIFVTGHSAQWNVEHYLAAGAIGLIAKPVDPMRVVAQLHGLWQRAGAVRGAAPRLAQTVSRPAPS